MTLRSLFERLTARRKEVPSDLPSARAASKPVPSYFVDDETLKEALERAIRESISTWDPQGIYAISLYVYDDNDNPFTPRVTLGYNTEDQVASMTPKAWDAGEARWNYAFWLQNEELMFGGDPRLDAAEGSAEMLRNWVIQKGFMPYTEDELYELDLPEEETIQVTWALVEVLIAIVQDLHSSGFIRRKFGRDIPIIIHELEYYKRILDQNVRANGAGIAREFIDYWETDFGWK